MATKAKKRGKKKNKLLMFTVSFVIFLVLSVIGGYFALMYAGAKMIDTTKLDALKTEPSIIFDKNGKEIMSLVRQKNTDYTPFHEISPMLIDALLSVEDKRFYEHKGIDVIRIGGAIVNDIRKGALAEGGSTITQQLARRVFLNAEKTFWRKTKEMSIAMALERNYSKDQIVEMYLNQIYFGEGVYGVGDAARVYFNKKPADLTLSEAAMLAAIPKAPSVYAPFANREKAKERRDTILRLMNEDGHITVEEKEKAQAEPLPEETKAVAQSGFKKGNRAFIDYVFREAEEKYDVTEEELYMGGWYVYTTLDSSMQDAMVNQYSDPKNFPKDGPERGVESAMIVVDAKNGGIAGMIGGRNYVAKGFNYATQMHRQPGSTFKPLAVYAPAIDLNSDKWGRNSSLSNKKQSFNGYEPRNYNNKYSDSVSMSRALIDSLNVPAVWLLNEIGIGESLKYLENFGIDLSPEDRNLAIALGGLDKGTSPLKMAQAYTAFANGGVVSEAFSISKIENKDLGVVHVHEDQQRNVLKPEASWEVHTMLEKAVQEGTGKAARISGRPVAGKTGTTQSMAGGNNVNKDAWFVGYTPEYVAAVWMGFEPEDKQHLMTQGSSMTAGMFSKVLAEGLKGVKSGQFVPPTGSRDKEEEVSVPPLNLAADMTLDNEKVVIVLSWIGGAPDYTYDLYRIKPNGERVLIANNLSDYQFVDILESTTLYDYVVVPKTADGEEKTPSNIAKVDTKQLEKLFEGAEQHHEDGTSFPIEGDGQLPGDWPEQEEFPEELPNGGFPGNAGNHGNNGNSGNNGNNGNQGNDGNGANPGDIPVTPPDIFTPDPGTTSPGIELPPPPQEETSSTDTHG